MTGDPAARLTGKRILITGGLGMIGSTIAGKLVKAGAHVTLVDACIEPYGANLFNLHDVRDKVEVNISDIRDRESMKVLVRDRDIIFNLAGQVSHNDSLNDPYLDADINYIGHLNVLECLRRNNRDAVILHAGSRLQFGRIERNPVDENHPLRPRTPYALNKTAAENTYRFYHEIHGIRTVSFRIANPYGPRSQMKHSKYSMINWFIRLAMEDKTIKVFGDGAQVRDYIYVDDLANAFVAAAVTEGCHGRAFNIGCGKGTTFSEMVGTVLKTVGTGRSELVPWPENYINVETGDYITNIDAFASATGWSPVIDLQTGIEQTHAYYQQHREHYW
ncbi:MAG: NAD-dependent epimerase/dehydratase family protein [Nitrospirota bacterium]|nr:NAD-dependent epimerase/dehydratase family protein [Nitrospirota bacterium]